VGAHTYSIYDSLSPGNRAAFHNNYTRKLRSGLLWNSLLPQPLLDRLPEVFFGAEWRHRLCSLQRINVHIQIFLARSIWDLLLEKVVESWLRFMFFNKFRIAALAGGRPDSPRMK
jgi:hypothetical protein